MRFCLSPTTSSPSSRRPGLPARLWRRSVGTEPPSLISSIVTLSPASISVSQSGSALAGARSGTTASAPWLTGPPIRMASSTSWSAVVSSTVVISHSSFWVAANERGLRSSEPWIIERESQFPEQRLRLDGNPVYGDTLRRTVVGEALVEVTRQEQDGKSALGRHAVDRLPRAHTEVGNDDQREAPLLQTLPELRRSSLPTSV